MTRVTHGMPVGAKVSRSALESWRESIRRALHAVVVLYGLRALLTLIWVVMPLLDIQSPWDWEQPAEIVVALAGTTSLGAFLVAVGRPARFVTTRTDFPSSFVLVLDWFIPFANLIRPIQHVVTVLEVLATSLMEFRVPIVLPIVWWSSWVAHTALNVMFVTMRDATSVESLLAAIVIVTLGFCGLTIATSTLLARYARDVIDRIPVIVEADTFA